MRSALPALRLSYPQGWLQEHGLGEALQACLAGDSGIAAFKGNSHDAAGGKTRSQVERPQVGACSSDIKRALSRTGEAARGRPSQAGPDKGDKATAPGISGTTVLAHHCIPFGPGPKPQRGEVRKPGSGSGQSEAAGRCDQTWRSGMPKTALHVLIQGWSRAPGRSGFRLATPAGRPLTISWFCLWYPPSRTRCAGRKAVPTLPVGTRVARSSWRRQPDPAQIEAGSAMSVAEGCMIGLAIPVPGLQCWDAPDLRAPRDSQLLLCWSRSMHWR